MGQGQRLHEVATVCRAGHDAGNFAIDQNGRSACYWRIVFDPNAAQAETRAALGRQNGRLASVVAFVRNRPAHPDFPRGNVAFWHVEREKKKTRFGAQPVERSPGTGHQAVAYTSLDNGVPQIGGVRCLAVDFKAVFASEAAAKHANATVEQGRLGVLEPMQAG